MTLNLDVFINLVVKLTERLSKKNLSFFILPDHNINSVFNLMNIYLLILHACIFFIRSGLYLTDQR
jgi:hypothetical protein